MAYAVWTTSPYRDVLYRDEIMHCVVFSAVVCLENPFETPEGEDFSWAKAQEGCHRDIFCTSRPRSQA